MFKENGRSMIKKAWNVIEKIMYVMVVKVLHITILEKNWESFLQFVKFGIIGVSNTVISYVIYIVSLLVLQKNSLFETTDYLLAQILGFLLSVLWSFYWNRKYVFDANQGQVPWLQALWKTYVSYAFTGLFLNTVLSMLWVELLGISKVIAPIFNIVINVPINFLMNKFWAFKKR